MKCVPSLKLAMALGIVRRWGVPVALKLILGLLPICQIIFVTINLWGFQMKHNSNVCLLKCDRGYKAEGDAFIECDDIDEEDDKDAQRWVPDPEKSVCVVDKSGDDYADISVCSPPEKLPLGDWKLSSDSSSALLTCPRGFVTPGEASSVHT